MNVSLSLATTGIALALATSCTQGGTPEGEDAARPDDAAAAHDGASQGRLTARPRERVRAPLAAGLQPLPQTGERETLLYVPSGYRAERPHGLVVLLHGAGGSARQGLAPLLPFADEAELLLVAVKSRRATWDILLESFGPDVSFIDRSLARVFARASADPARVAIGGFSDGASYALSLGLANGDLFRAVIAFSPGFVASAGRRGRPRVFISHGMDDRVLPIDATSRRIVPELEGAGYEVRYREFRGSHAVPPPIAREALAWFASPARRGRE